MMKNVWVLGLSLLLAGCGGGLFGGGGIAVVDLSAVAKALGRDDVIQQQVVAENEKLTNELKAYVGELQTQLETRKNGLGEAPEQAEQEKLRQLVAQANQQIVQTRQLALRKSQQYQATLIVEFRKEVADIAEVIARELGSQAVVAVDDTLLWFDSGIDITDEVIAKMREQ